MPSINVPGVGVVNFPDGMSQQDIVRAIEQDILPQAQAAQQNAPKPQTGFFAGLKGGFESLKGDVAALGVPLGIEGSAQAAEEYKKKAEQKYRQPEFTESPWEYTKGLAGQSLAYMGAPLAAGAAAAFLAPEAAVAGIGAAALARFGTSAAQFVGSNINRQIESGTKPENVDAVSAVGAAIPQALLDAVALGQITGMQRIFKEAGKSLSREEAAAIVRNGVVGTTANAVKAYGPAVLKSMGTEGLTEAAQQVLERAQAGLDITDEQARKEYFDNFLGGAILGGGFAVPGHAMNRAEARAKYAAQDERTKNFPNAVQADLALEGGETAPEQPVAVDVGGQRQMFADAGFQNQFARDVAASEAEQAQIPQQVASLRERHDTLMREIDRLKEQYATATTQEEQAAAVKQASALNAEREQVAKQIAAITEAEAVPRPGTPEARAAETDLPTTITAPMLETAGLSQRSGLFKQLVGKDLTDFPQLDEVQQIIERARTNKNLTQETKDALESIYNTARNTYSQQGEMLGPRGGVLEPARTPRAPKATAEDKIAEIVAGKDLADPAQVEAVREEVTDYANAPNRSQADIDAAAAFLDSLPSAAPEATDVIQPTEPVEPTGEPSPAVVEQRGEAPAGGVEAPQAGGVDVAGGAAEYTDAGEAVQPAALTEESNAPTTPSPAPVEPVPAAPAPVVGEAAPAVQTPAAPAVEAPAPVAPTEGQVDIRTATDRLMREGNLKRAEASKFAEQLADSFGAVSEADLAKAVAYVRGDRAVYRTGSKGEKGVPAARVQALVDSIVSRWKNAPKIQVVQSTTELPSGLQQQIVADNVAPPGAFDPDSETVFLIADNIVSDEDAALTLAHESLGHYGLRSILGNSYGQMMDSIYDGNASVRKEALAKMGQGLDKQTAVEEVLAEMAEKGTYNNAIQRIFNAIRQFFRRIGISSDKITDTEIRELLANAQRFVIAGGSKAEGITAFRGKPLYRTRKEQAGALTPEGEKAAALNERMKGISNPQPDGVDTVAKGFLGLNKFFNRGENDPTFGTYLRGQIVDKDASANEKIQAAFNNKVVNYIDGRVRADLLVDQSQDHAAFAEEVLSRGVPVIGKDGLAEVQDSEDNMQNIFNIITEKLGKRLGSADLAMQVAHNAGIAKRADELLKHNAVLEKQIQAAEKKKNFKAANQLREAQVTVRAAQSEIDAGLEAYNTYPEIREALEMFTRYNNKLIDFLVACGRIDAATAENWKANTGYVPWTRVEEEVNAFEDAPVRGKVGLLNVGKLPILDRQGSSKEIANIFDNMIGHTSWVIRTALTARAANAFAQDLPDAKEITSDIELQQELKKNRSRVIFTYKDGERTPYLLGSAADMPAFMIAPDVIPGIAKPFKAFSDILRNFVTHMPAFALGQLIQDGTYRGMMLSGVEHPFAIPPKVFKNFYQILTGESGIAAELARLGVSGVYDGMPEHVISRAREKFGLKEKTAFQKAWGGLEKFSLAADLAVRAAIYEQTLAETKSDVNPQGDRALALYRAKEYINFKRAGANPIVRGLRHVVPFMNAYIQGMDVLVRTMQGKGVSTADKRVAMQLFWATGIKLMALNVLYTMLVGDDDDYKGLDEYERAKNYIIPGTGLKLPVAPELGFMFKVIPELMTNYIISQGTERPDDAANVYRAMRDAFVNSYGGVNLTPQLVKPALEVAVNYSFFTSNPIVGQAMKNVDPSQQFTSSTSEFSKFVGGIAGISPLKLDYLVRGYTGMLGAFALDATDAVANPNRVDKPINKLPQVSTFMYDPTGRGYKSEFYRFREDVDRVVDTVNLFKREGRADELREYLTEDRMRVLAMRGVTSKIEETLGKLRKYRNIVANDPNMSGEEKLAITQEVQAREKAILLAFNVPKLRQMALGE